jgi:hypothetical protein
MRQKSKKVEGTNSMEVAYQAYRPQKRYDFDGLVVLSDPTGPFFFLKSEPDDHTAVITPSGYSSGWPLPE